MAGAGVVVEDDELGGVEEDDGVLELAGVDAPDGDVAPFVPPEARAALGTAAGADEAEPVNLIERKSMCEPVEMWSSW